MTRSCYDCPYCKQRYNGTLIATAFCDKYKKAIPTNNLCLNFFCEVENVSETDVRRKA